MGTEMRATPVIIRVPYTAWMAPPPSPSTLRIDHVKNVPSKRARPLARVEREPHERHEGEDEGRHDEAPA